MRESKSESRREDTRGREKSERHVTTYPPVQSRATCHRPSAACRTATRTSVQTLLHTPQYTLYRTQPYHHTAPQHHTTALTSQPYHQTHLSTVTL
eukprot:2906419-Rhodomonas_salina.1